MSGGINKILSALLTYPTPEIKAAAPEMQSIVEAEAKLATPLRDELLALIHDLALGDLYDLQERYVLLFDRTRSLSLYLFEHVHGESRDRGQAMVDLQNLYETHGLYLTAKELPDFIPLFLEFLSTRPDQQASDLLAQTAHIFAALAERLAKRQSPYEAVFRALVALAASVPKGEDVSALLQQADPDPNDLAALDAAWEDQPVSFGAGAGNGCKDELIARIRAGRRPAPGTQPAREPQA
ncbi:nitrate reductase 1 molybdenum cofactor assembly chaperone [Hyphomicrobium sp. 1Nfss2.1]|uniref:nitrate reductase molybdenum cofactor assembly chaperone n=1 Tax=Hyphomicrobium sp. 1Nfss2.1 TaxID=3413936 RepID=UPI003C7B23EB